MIEKSTSPRDRGMVDPDLPHAYARGEARAVCCYCGDYPGEPIHAQYAAKLLSRLASAQECDRLLDVLIAHFEGPLEYWGVVQDKNEPKDGEANPEYDFAQANVLAFDEVIGNLRLMKDGVGDE